MSEIQTNGNGATEIKTTVLDGAKKRFEARKDKAKDVDVSKALTEYLKLEDAIREHQEKIEDLKMKRTDATKEIVALRGMGRLKSKAKGTGQIIARGEAAWIAFQTAEGPEF